MIATSARTAAAIIFFFSFGLFGSKNFMVDLRSCVRAAATLKIGCQIHSQTHQRRIPSGQGLRRGCISSECSRRRRDHWLILRDSRLRYPFELDRVNNQELVAGLKVAHKVSNVLIWTFDSYAHGDTRIDALPLGVALLLSRNGRLDLLLCAHRIESRVSRAGGISQAIALDQFVQDRVKRHPA